MKPKVRRRSDDGLTFPGSFFVFKEILFTMAGVATEDDDGNPVALCRFALVIDKLFIPKVEMVVVGRSIPLFIFAF